MRGWISVLLVVAALAAAAADASVVPSWSYLPAAVRGQLAAEGDGTLYLPARTPAFYRYRAGAKVVAGVLSVPFTNRVRIRAGLWRWTAQTFLWHVQPATPSIDCRAWRKNERTLQLSGNKVYSGQSATGGSIAWRCVTDRNGRTLILSSSTVRAGQGVAMGVAVAGALDVSRRSMVHAVRVVRPSLGERPARSGSATFRAPAGWALFTCRTSSSRRSASALPPSSAWRTFATARP